MTAIINGPASEGDKNEDSNSYSSLCKCSIERCDFCEKVFNNRYSILVHNSTHIIIPLWKQTLLQCEECLCHFPSQDNLNDHIVRKHPKMMAVLQAIGSECRVNVQPMWMDGKEVVQCNEKPVEIVSLTAISPNKPQSLGQKKRLLEYPRTSGLKNKIVFEDQEDDIISLNTNGIIDDLTTECTVKVEKFKAPWLHRGEKQKYQVGMNDGEFKQNGIADVMENYTSVHYDDLVVAGEFNCKHCGKGCTNRLRLIKHETKHIRFKRPRPVLCPHCDRYFGGNYRTLHRHIDKSHPNTTLNVKCLQKPCQQCGLKYYDYTRHENNYHSLLDCKVFNKKIELDNIEGDNSEHDTEVLPKMNGYKKTWHSKDVKVCEMCFSFLRNKQNMQYVHLRDINELGVRQVCEKCGHNFFEVKLVRLLQRPSHFNERKRRPVSNTDRLKHIQLRLKMINKLNKY